MPNSSCGTRFAIPWDDKIYVVQRYEGGNCMVPRASFAVDAATGIQLWEGEVGSSEVVVPTPSYLFSFGDAGLYAYDLDSGVPQWWRVEDYDFDYEWLWALPTGQLFAGLRAHTPWDSFSWKFRILSQSDGSVEREWTFADAEVPSQTLDSIFLSDPDVYGVARSGVGGDCSTTGKVVYINDGNVLWEKTLGAPGFQFYHHHVLSVQVNMLYGFEDRLGATGPERLAFLREIDATTGSTLREMSFTDTELVPYIVLSGPHVITGAATDDDFGNEMFKISSYR